MLKKSLFIILSVILCHLSANAQRTLELGPLIGRAYYIGELNPESHLGNGVGSMVFGGALRYNLNKRYSLKATVVRTTVEANDRSADLQFNTFRNASMSSTITELAGSIEFNFLPYKTGEKGERFTPYLFIGISYYSFDPTISVDGFDPAPVNVNGGSKFAFPFGPGMRLSIGRKTSLAFEWGFRKTSNDLIDGLENRFDEDGIYETGKNNDNDWYVVSGFMLTYRLTKLGACPVYNF